MRKSVMVFREPEEGWVQALLAGFEERLSEKDAVIITDRKVSVLTRQKTATTIGERAQPEGGVEQAP